MIDHKLWLINNHVYHKLLYKMFTGLLWLITNHDWSMIMSITKYYTNCIHLIVMIADKSLYKMFTLIVMIDHKLWLINNHVYHKMYTFDCYDWSQIIIQNVYIDHKPWLINQSCLSQTIIQNIFVLRSIKHLNNSEYSSPSSYKATPTKDHPWPYKRGLLSRVWEVIILSLCIQTLT